MENLGVMERIAIALERIANYLETQPNGTQSVEQLQKIQETILPSNNPNSCTIINQNNNTNNNANIEANNDLSDSKSLTLTSNQVVVDYLASKNILVKTIPEETEADEVLAQLQHLFFAILLSVNHFHFFCSSVGTTDFLSLEDWEVLFRIA